MSECKDCEEYRNYIKALWELVACYQLQKRPSEKLWDALEAGREFFEAHNEVRD